MPSATTLEELELQLEERFRSKLRLDSTLTRTLVSHQGNRDQPIHQWFKYKEAFSASLVERYLFENGEKPASVLDPFAGAGTTLITASQHGVSATGIELLPIGHYIVQAKEIGTGPRSGELAQTLETWSDKRPWASHSALELPELRITKGAYPKDTKRAIGQYLSALATLADEEFKILAFTALLSCLEEISYTRKDGQYLRWDSRATERQLRGEFSKGDIYSFDEAMCARLRMFARDLRTLYGDTLFSKKPKPAQICLHRGSCLDILPTLGTSSYDRIITSPPYCNRYDYTRTYALELAAIGVTEDQVRRLRQTMLSCTVENKPKDGMDYRLVGLNDTKNSAGQKLIAAICEELDSLASSGSLNNKGIATMVRGYFAEMFVVVEEMVRLLAPNGRAVVVNDNVRFAGIHVPVDLILSSHAEHLGMNVEKIAVLPQNKGNSSQQMAEYGRMALRKCVYEWRK